MAKPGGWHKVCFLNSCHNSYIQDEFDIRLGLAFINLDEIWAILDL